MTTRLCFLPPIPELHLAADLLSAAADCLLGGDPGRAGALSREADMPAVRAHACRIMGKTDVDMHRYRPVAGTEWDGVQMVRAEHRMPSAPREAAIFRRDGYRCRYCGCRVFLRSARFAMRKLIPDAVPWGRKDRDKHAALHALTATADHLVPHARGGDNSPDNLVTACRCCDFGKGDWLIQEIDIADPRDRPPVVDAWDGLARLAGRGAPVDRGSGNGLIP